MADNIDFTLVITITACVLFFLMVAVSELGRRIGTKRIANDPKGLAEGVGAAEGAVFALLGLVIAFTFSGAATRLEERRHLITEEANAIGTAYLRIDLLSKEAQPEIRKLFHNYTGVRATFYQDRDNKPLMKIKQDKVADLQNRIWTLSLSAVRMPVGSPQAPMLLIPALNAMIDIITTREMATKNHPPVQIYIMLYGLSFVGSLLVGYSMSVNQERSWLHTLSFSAVMSLAIYVIVDLEYPRLGLIRVDSSDHVLFDLQKSMEAEQKG
jgi:hypothetical protein